jgi:hypothetical protein
MLCSNRLTPSEAPRGAFGGVTGTRHRRLQVALGGADGDEACIGRLGISLADDDEVTNAGLGTDDDLVGGVTYASSEHTLTSAQISDGY